MNKFRFSAESVIRHREWLEEEAQRVLGKEISLLQILETGYLALQNERAKYTDQRRTSLNLTPEIHLSYVSFDKKLKQDLDGQQEKIRAQKMVVREKTKILEKAVKERKKLEKLREREWAEYQKKSRRKETSTMDEVSANFKGRNSLA